MTDSVISPESGGGERPSISDFDPAEGVLPESVAPSGEAAGTVMLLVDVAADQEWADRTAVAIATAWARSGQRVVLADLHLEDPRLHSLLGESNLDGVTDIFLYGSSLARSAKPIPGRDFYLLTAGTYTPEPGQIYRHPRWEKLIAGFAEAGACFVLYLPGDDIELAPLEQWGGEVVLLGEPENVRSVQSPPSLRVRAVLSPPKPLELEEESVSPWSAEVGDGWEHEELERVAPESGEPDDSLPDRETAAFGVAEPEIHVEPAPPPKEPVVSPVEESEPQPAHAVVDPALEEPPVVSPEVRRRRRTERNRVSPVLLALLALVVGGGAYALFASNPDILAGLGGGESAVEPEVTAAPPPPPAPTPAGEPLPYAVPVAAFPTLDPARALADANAAQFGIPMYVAPELIQGVQYYRVLAGLPQDTAAAAVLRERLVDAGVIEPRDALGELERVRPARLAFDLGEYPTRAAAEAKADTLVASGIPVYPVALPYSDGTERWRLYGGAYADSVQAEAMRQLLAGAGLPTRLVTRVGGQAAPAR